MTTYHKPLTAAEIEKLRELEAKATPGEWEVVYRSSDELQTTFVGLKLGNEIFEIGSTTYGKHTHDAALIAAMRNALPRLLSMLQPPADAPRVCNESECRHVQNSAEATTLCLEYQATIARLVADLERLSQPPADAAVREAVEFMEECLDIPVPGVLNRHDAHLRTLLSYVRSAQAELEGYRLAVAVKTSAASIGEGSVCATQSPSRCCGNCARSAACSRNANPNECVLFVPGPSDAAVREAMDYFDNCLAIPVDGVFDEHDAHLRTLLSYVRAAQSQRLTGERLEAVRHASTQLDWYCQHLNDADSKSADRLRAAFPELGEG